MTARPSWSFRLPDARPGRGLLGRLAVGRRGVSAIEFALIFPVMLLIYIGGFETGQVLSVNRRVTHVGATVGDLVAQVASVTTSDIENVFDASTALMMPYSTTSLKMTVSTVLYSSGKQTVTWSKTRNGTAWTAKSTPPVTIPTAMLVDGQEVVVSQVSYTYTSQFTAFMQDIWGKSSIDMSDVTYYRPRVSNTVALK
jgi:Flp pilus assembly protein TadG